MAHAAFPQAPPKIPSKPVVPESLFDVPSQRTYVIGVGCVLQAIKAYEFIRCYIPGGSDALRETLLWKWTLVDATYILLVPMLRIPWLIFPRRSRAWFIVSMLFLNWLAMGEYTIPTSALVPIRIRGLFEYDIAISEKHVRIRDVIQPASHLQGKHTVRLSPISTAELNPHKHTYCFDPHKKTLSLPVLLNNTSPKQLTFCVTSLEDALQRNCVELGQKELKRDLQVAKRDPFSADFDFDDDDDEEEYDEQGRRRIVSVDGKSFFGLEKTQSLTHIHLKGPGIVQLSRVHDSSGADVRIYSGQTTVVECPNVKFSTPNSQPGIRCIGDTDEAFVELRGVPPLSVKYVKTVDGKVENLQIDGVEGDHGTTRPGVAQLISIPFNISFAVSGQQSYDLQSITDGLGHTVMASYADDWRPITWGEPEKVWKQKKMTFIVHRPSGVSFKGCSIENPLGFRRGEEVTLSFSMTDGLYHDQTGDVHIDFKPSHDNSSKHAGRWPRSVHLEYNKDYHRLKVDEAGDYTIKGFEGRWCDHGEVLSPSTCRVEEYPVPSVNIELEPIQDMECRVEVGARANLVLHGRPPFTISYKGKRNDENPRQYSKTFQSARGEILLQPEAPGTYTYTFTGLKDKNYDNIKLSGPTREQVVHSLASASLVRKQGGILLRSCSGDTVDVEVELKGTPPWNLEMQIGGPRGTDVIMKAGLTKTREKITIAVPKDVNEEGGQFLIDLVSVEDKAMCKRLINVPGITVNVNRVKPTARFYSSETSRQMVTLEGEAAQLPIRLTGEAPWDVTYRSKDKPRALRHAKLLSANDYITVQERGEYELVEVRDAHCPGDVVVSEADFGVQWTARPMVAWAPEAGKELNGESLVRTPVCVGVADHVDIAIHGTPPFEVYYTHALNAQRPTERGPISAVGNVARIDLSTTWPGRHVYELSRLGDSSYPVVKVANPGSASLRLEQEILARPAASFKSDLRLPFCLNDSFVPRQRFSEEGFVFLEGQPPFTLDLSIKNSASSTVKKEVVTIDSHEWQLSLPGYTFDHIGPHLIRIESVKDTSPCRHSSLDLGLRSFWVDVAETAAIVPMERRTDYCAGETLQYQLEGTSPWRVNYMFNGKEAHGISKTAKFSRIAESPGNFSITSISHQQNLCETKVDDLEAIIHPLPSARVSHGRAYSEDIREGEQAEIVFDLIGEPPFTFTYQRSEFESIGWRGKPARVLETHTVTTAESNYTVLSALEGTWTVTFIADKYCRYPPAPPASPERTIIEKL